MPAIPAPGSATPRMYMSSSYQTPCPSITAGFVAKAATKPRLLFPAEGGHANKADLAEGDGQLRQ